MGSSPHEKRTGDFNSHHVYKPQQSRPHVPQQSKPHEPVYKPQQSRPHEPVYKPQQSRPHEPVYKPQQLRPHEPVYKPQQSRPHEPVYKPQQSRRHEPVYKPQQSRPQLPQRSGYQPHPVSYGTKPQQPGYQPHPLSYGTKPQQPKPQVPHPSSYKPKPSLSGFQAKPQLSNYKPQQLNPRVSQSYGYQLKPPTLRRSSEKSSADRQARSFLSDGTLGGASGYYLQSVGPGSKRSSGNRVPALDSPCGSPSDNGSPPGANFPGVSPNCGSSVGIESCNLGLGTGPLASKARLTTSSGKLPTAQSTLHYTLSVLQQVRQKLLYLESMEESVRQLGDSERLRGVSMAQQGVSLAQILKAQQQRHERDLYDLRIKAEGDAPERQLQPEESTQRAGRVHAELQENIPATSQHQPLGGLQNDTAKMMSQHAETARYTANAPRHIKEMTELACSQIAGAPISTPPDHQKECHMRPLQARADTTDSSRSEVSGSCRTRPEEPLSPLDSFSHNNSLSSRRPTISGGDTNIHPSPLPASLAQRERRRTVVAEHKRRKEAAEERSLCLRREEAGSSLVEDDAPTGVDNSLCTDSITSIVEEKALSDQRNWRMDGEEEKRSKNEAAEKRNPCVSREKEAGSSLVEDDPTGVDDSLRTVSITSTVEEKADSTTLATECSRKVKESMTEDKMEEQSFCSLLPSEVDRCGTLEKSRPHVESEEDPANQPRDMSRACSGQQDSFSQFTMDIVLRQYVTDEEVRLQHQSSLLRLRQKTIEEKTKTELAWLEHQKKSLRNKGEDDKVPPIREKQKGLKLKLQQEKAEIHCLQEANKEARKARLLLLKQQEEIERMRTSTLRVKERIRIAGGEAPPETTMSETLVSEAASLITRLADSDVHSPSPPLSMSGRSETSSIMKLKKMHSHMDETFLTKREQQLMQRRRHAEEQLEWKQRLDREEEEVRRMEQEALAVWDHHNAAVGPFSSLQHHSPEHRTDSEKKSDYSVTIGGGPSTAPPKSFPEIPLASKQSKPSTYTQDFTSTSPPPSKPSVPAKESLSTAPSPSNISATNTKMQLCSATWTTSNTHIQPIDTPTTTQTEPVSDQIEIESRIRVLKEELRKSKSMAYQLKKEQKKRNKERLKAQEASLLKQLESYNDFNKKTTAELNKEPSRSISLAEEQSEDPPTVTPTPLYGSPEYLTSGSGHLLSENPPRPASREARSLSGQAQQQDTSVLSIHRSVIEELEVDVDYKSEDQHSGCLLKLDHEERPSAPQKLFGSEHVPSSKSEEHKCSPSIGLDRDVKMTREISEEESLVSHSSKSHLAAVDTSVLPDNSVSSNGCAYTPDSTVLSSKMQALSETSHSSADCYHDDYESLPREYCRSSKPTSTALPSCPEIKASKDSCSRSPHYVIQDEEDEVEEDIAEELCERSAVSGDSHPSGRLLNLHSQTIDSRIDTKNNINANCSPAISPSQSPLSLVPDQMPCFNIGDRVLVSNVHSGTLKFKGPTKFSNGFWAGVELDESEASNNGTYDNVVYFECEERHGIFAPPNKITRLPEKFETYMDTTEDEDSLFDDLSDEDGNKRETAEKKTLQLGYLKSESGGTDEDHRSAEYQANHQKNLTSPKGKAHLSPHNPIQSEHPVRNGGSQYIMLEFDDAPPTLISDMSKLGQGKQSLKAFAEQKDKNSHSKSPRPELPLFPLLPKLPEQPAMVVPHSASEVEKLVHAATREIWDSCQLAKQNTGTLSGLTFPKPSQEYLGKEANRQDQEALCIRSYRQAVYDLTREILHEIYTEDPNVGQSQWVKRRPVGSSYFHKVKTAGDITKVQEFVATEVLKLYGLEEDHNQKPGWQRRLKFGMKKQDRVDHILVQELHEEEAQWVNYDEDELLVKMHLADSIFDTLLKDTADALTQICDKRAKRAALP